MMRTGPRRAGLLRLGALQLIVILYTFASAAAKMASGYPFFSAGFLLCYGAELFFLAAYALLWQQALKRVSLSTAYANRAAAVFWAMLWSALLFRETVTLRNLLGVLVIFAGVLLVNSGREEEGAS